MSSRAVEALSVELTPEERALVNMSLRDLLARAARGEQSTVPPPRREP
jgi:hypothetical protein